MILIFPNQKNALDVNQLTYIVRRKNKYVIELLNSILLYGGGQMDISVESMGEINDIFDNAYEDGRETLYEHEVYMILKSIGLDVPKFVFVKNADELTEKMLEKFGRDIVVKIVSSDISHKQKLGGVKVIKNDETLYVGYVLDKMRKEVLSHFEDTPNIEGFLIVEFIPHTQSIGYEILIGAKDDVSFGPVITFTKGGDDEEFFAKY
jgi:acyl-CoA synthetase (NDP forming)